MGKNIIHSIYQEYCDSMEEGRETKFAAEEMEKGIRCGAVCGRRPVRGTAADSMHGGRHACAGELRRIITIRLKVKAEQSAFSNCPDQT